MTDLTIHNFQYFLEELEKNLKSLDSLAEQESNIRESIHILQGTMSKMCANWINLLKYH